MATSALPFEADSEKHISGPGQTGSAGRRKSPSRLQGATGYLTGLTAGLTLVFSNTWFYLAGYSPVFASSPSFLGRISSVRLAYFIALILSALVASVFDLRAAVANKHISLATSFALLLGTGLFVFAPYQSLFPPAPIVVVGSALMGFAQASVSLSMLRIAVEHFSLKQAVLVFAISYAVANMVFSGVFVLVSERQHPLLLLLLTVPLSLFFSLIQRAIGAENRGISEATAPRKEFTFASLIDHRAEVGQLAAMILTIVALRGINKGGIWGGGSYLDYTGNLYPLIVSVLSMFAFLAFAIPIYLFYVKQSSAMSLITPFLVLTALLLFLAITHSLPPIPGVDAVVERYCVVLYLLVIVTTAKNLRLSGYRIAGIAMGIMWTLSLLWILFIEEVHFAAPVVILLFSYLSVVAIVLVKNEYHDTSRDVDDGLPSPSSVQTCERLAVTYGLTARESEILFLLAKGRSLPFIQAKLVLANGTVRTHVKHIYLKLNIHSKQELLTLLENCSESAQVEQASPK